ncbi:FAD-dependent oxidoreductase [uncultured Fusobacterium sp.]|jgi:thioredoxin reductase (NADPH)|uniref:FAD-dependent oxidoreductase n=1 Tax=uncultured Fusobacterium sp. TaxID=159267 RepID=UPI0025E7C5F3|nr:FAD-dependent oxidoreductase [uncultured Fusobacterium sp.]
MEKIYDLIIIGGGPTGLTAGIYAGRAKLNVLILEKSSIGGQIYLTNEVANYPGIFETTGSNYAEQLKKQAEAFGVEIISGEVTNMDFSKEIKEIKTSTDSYKGYSVLIATGASPRKLGFPGEEEYTGRGVAYCATCDGEFFTDMDVFVIGAGFAAAEEAMFLTKFARKVTVIAREPEFTCAKSIADKVLANPKIEVKFNTEILEAKGDIQLRSAKFKNNVTNETFEYKANEGESFGIFVFIGYEPQSKLFKDIITLDNQGFIPTDEDLATNIEGVYAAGDIRPKKLRQLVTAVSDGATAAFSIEKYVHDLKGKLGVEKEENNSKTTSEIKHPTKKFLDDNIQNQLKDIFSKFDKKVKVVLIKDPEIAKSTQMEEFLSEISSLSDKIDFQSLNKNENLELEKKIDAERFPTIAFFDQDNNFKGVKFSTLPGGHELNSFILALYNIAGAGQKISEESKKKIDGISTPHKIKIGVTLSCSRCPESVQSAQRIAIENSNLDVEVIDVFTFPKFREKFEIMSVPAIIIDDKLAGFGQKNIEQFLELIK